MFKRKNNQEFFPFSKWTITNSKNSFRRLLEQFSDNMVQIDELCRFVISKYSENHRFYHNLSHVKDLLFSAKSLEGKFADYESVQFAIWFHDVIYEPQKHD